MKKFVLATIVLALGSLSFAGTQRPDNASHQREALASAAQRGSQTTAQHPFGVADCAFTFTSGANNTFLKFCVTATGNVTVFQSPQGHEHIAVGQDGEGYGICGFDNNNNPVAYNDYAEFGNSGNWGPATVVSHSAKSVKIARTTSDGVWTLTQTFTQVTGISPFVKIQMALTNNTAVERLVLLLRYANVDADGVFANNLDATNNSAFGWNSIGGTNPNGLVLQNLGFPNAAFRGLVQNVPDGPSPCDPGANEADGPVTGTDGSIVMIYELEMRKFATQTISVRYKGF